MPQTRLVYYRESDGSVPLEDWLAALPRKAQQKCAAYLARLEFEGHDLRRPIADYLRDGIYELRPSRAGVRYRILYFFHGKQGVVVSHGLIQEQTVPPKEIERAVRRMQAFLADPRRHTFDPEKRS